MRKFLAIVSIVAISLLSGCASTGIVPIAQTPAQIAAQVCPLLQVTVSGMQALVGLPIGAQADLATAAPVISAVCSINATVDLASLQTLEQTALPTLIAAVKASTMATEDQNRVILDIDAAQLIISAVTVTQVTQSTK
jgi:hypothetical protein